MDAANRSAYIYTGDKWQELDQSYNAWLLQFERECIEARIEDDWNIDMTKIESGREVINSRLAYYMVSMRPKDAEICQRTMVFEDTGIQCQLIWAPSNADHTQWCRGKFKSGKDMQGSNILRQSRGSWF